MEMMSLISESIATLGFPIACVVALGWYSKSTTDKIIELTSKVTEALVSSNEALHDYNNIVARIERGDVPWLIRLEELVSEATK